MSNPSQPFGMVAEFTSASQACAAGRRLRDGGWQRWDLYAPTPLDEFQELIPGRQAHALTALMIIAGLLGGALGYGLQYWSAVYSYPIDVGGRPDGGGPGFIPSAWEACALCAVWSGLIAFLICRRLPQLYHPLFSAAGFERASQDRFFICVERQDRKYDAGQLTGLFQDHGALHIEEIGP